jgi:glycosyltransferase involved in cell wall biosynthesis
MIAVKAAPPRGKKPHILFVQAVEAAAYPPIIHAASLLAEAGWHVCVLSAPVVGLGLDFPAAPGIELRAIATRPSHIMTRASYAAYAAAAARIAIEQRPDIVYASDPLGAAPGLLAARLAGARLVYHEHDTPNPGTLTPILARLRRAAAQRAALVIFPNETRARIARTELGFSEDRLNIVWNMPRLVELPLAELPQCENRPDEPLLLYYHGSISPVRLPETVLEAVRQFAGRVRLSIAGYEAPGAPGYVKHLLRYGKLGPESPVRYLGQIPQRSTLLEGAARAHVGLATVPAETDDCNIRYLAGASNKAFDYMAAGLALLVSDLPDWRRMFVMPGYARSCMPSDAASIKAALSWFIDNKEARRAMGARGRTRIASDWNYDTAFRGVLGSLTGAPEMQLPGRRAGIVRSGPDMLTDRPDGAA